MSKVAFLGFGEVNTPVDVIVRKCSVAEAALKAEGLDLVSVYPIADDYEEKDVAKAVAVLEKENFDAVVVCIAGWIPTHAVLKVTEHYRHLPMVLWDSADGMKEADLLQQQTRLGQQDFVQYLKGLGTSSNMYTISSVRRRKAP